MFKLVSCRFQVSTRVLIYGSGSLNNGKTLSAHTSLSPNTLLCRKHEVNGGLSSNTCFQGMYN